MSLDFEHLPRPVIALAVKGLSRAERRAADVVVDTPAELAALEGRIAANPQATSVLVQLLRTTEKLPVADALFAESLAYATLQSGPEYRRWLEAHRGSFPVPRPDPGPAVVIERSG